jgi:hypothetical protein
MLTVSAAPGAKQIFSAPVSAGRNRTTGPAFRKADAIKQPALSPAGFLAMSPILPISFLVTLLCAFGAIEGVPFQQLMFVGAALSATILVCSFDAWSAREIPVRNDDETRLRSHSDR